MGFRTIVIREQMKLDLHFNYMQCRNTKTQIKVFIPEISMLIIESTCVSLTSALISELVKNKIKIVFCDEKHNPESEITPYYGVYNNVRIIEKQIKWNKKSLGNVWARIIAFKIQKQRDFLIDLNLNDEAQLLTSYLKDIKYNDITNREGHSAKVYFNAIWGKAFNRRDTSFVNSALNYGYSIILSCFNRAVNEKGYLTQLGIWHRNETNYFNLTCDLMEPFRILIDRLVYNLEDDCVDFKRKMLAVLEGKIRIDGKEHFLENAISFYIQSVFDAIEKGDSSLIKMYD